MRLGIVSDIHCHLDALQATLACMGDVDQLICAGDAFHEYRFSNEVTELLIERDAIWVLGNHELGLLGPSGDRAHGREGVRADLVEHVRNRPLELRLRIDGCTVLLTHGSPVAPHGRYVYPGSRELREIEAVDADVVILGHTHVQMDERVGRVRVLNPGSVGDPRDPRNGRRGSCGVLDVGSGEFTVHDFDVALAG